MLFLLRFVLQYCPDRDPGLIINSMKNRLHVYKCKHDHFVIILNSTNCSWWWCFKSLYSDDHVFIKTADTKHMEKQDCLVVLTKGNPSSLDVLLMHSVLINTIVPAMSLLSLSSGECKEPWQKKENYHCDSCVQHKRLPRGQVIPIISNLYSIVL